MPRGTVKWFNFTKGYGFIEQDDGDDLFVHKSQVSGRGLREGDVVEFEIGDSDKGPNAINVSKMDEEE
jgi:CspA family cold shock protein